MPGKTITQEQVNLYMSYRKNPQPLRRDFLNGLQDALIRGSTTQLTLYENTAPEKILLMDYLSNT